MSRSHRLSSALLPMFDILSVTRSGRDLSWIEDPVRIKSLLDRSHHFDPGMSVLGDEEARLAVSDAVLPSTGPVISERTVHQPGVELLGALDVLGVIRVDEHADVEVAVAHMTDDRGCQAMLSDVGLSCGDAVGQRRDRHANVRGQPRAAGTHRSRRIVGAVTSAPQPAALSLIRGPDEVAPAVLGGDRRRLLRLSADILLTERRGTQ